MVPSSPLSLFASDWGQAKVGHVGNLPGQLTESGRSNKVGLVPNDYREVRLVS